MKLELFKMESCPYCRKVLRCLEESGRTDVALLDIVESEDNRERLDRLRRNLRRALEKELTPRQRQILELYYGQQLSVTRIGSLLGVAPSTVSRTLRRAKDKLRRYLQYSL